MFLVRLAAFLQVTFLPGYLFLAVAGFDRSHRLQTLVRAFAASLILNWVLVFALTAAHVYHPVALWIVFAAECGWFVRLHWRKKGPEDLLGLARLEPLRDAPLPFQAALALGVVSALVVASYFFRNADAVVSEWDAVVSWNRWATEWAANGFPVNAQHYPQLLPASWSMLYVFAGDTTVQSPVRMLQALYPLGIVLVFLDAGLRHRSARVLLAASVWTPFIYVVSWGGWAAPPDGLSNGYAELPVAFFGLLAVVTALYAEERTERDWWLALFFGCGAALTKQAGLYAMAFVWVYALVELRSRRFALRSAALVLGLVGSWYGMKQLQIAMGLDGSEIDYVTGGVHQGRGPLERLLFAGVLLGRIPYLGKLGLAGLLAGAGLVLASLRDARQRVIVLGLVLPFLTIWAFLYSYDLRNAALVMPLVVLAACHALPARDLSWRPSRLELAAVAALGVAIAGSIQYDEAETQKEQVAKRRQIWDAPVNAALYQYFDANPPRGKVVTAYQILAFLPGFEGKVRIHPGPLRSDDLEKLDADPEVSFLLHPLGWMSPGVRSTLDERVAAGRYRHVMYVRNTTGLGVLRLVQLKP